MNKKKERNTQRTQKENIVTTVTIGVMFLGFLYFAGSLTQSYLQLEQHKMDVIIAGETAKGYAIRDIAIVALQQKLEGSFNTSLNALVECDYDGWHSLPVTVNKTTNLAQVLGMLPDNAHCVIKATGGFGGTGSIPVLLMDDESMNYLTEKAEVLT